jgi:hypothetical protein
VLNVVVLLAAVLVLYFVFRRPPASLAPTDPPVAAPVPAAGTPTAPAAPR